MRRPTRSRSLSVPPKDASGGALDLEGTEICDWLTSRGITCVLLKYRVPDSGPTWKDDSRYPPRVQTALQDAQRTLGLVRQHAAQWHVDPHKVGVIGFSAGGYLVADVSTHFAQRTYPPVDAADELSCRPDFAIAVYPGHLWTHETDLSLRPNIRVRADTPPTFLLQAEDDQVDSVKQSLAYYVALQEAGVPTEIADRAMAAVGGAVAAHHRRTQPAGKELSARSLNEGQLHFETLRSGDTSAGNPNAETESSCPVA